MRGKLITFEGSEGSGKSTQIKLLHRFLAQKGLPVLILREPGGTAIGEKIRKILLDRKNKGMSAACETMLYMAARSQLVSETIQPSLQKGKIVLCDRFLDSTTVYQGHGHGIDPALIKTMGSFATHGIAPDLTFVFDIDAAHGLSRIRRERDRIEQRNLAYHQRVREGYLALAKAEPLRVRLIDGTKTRQEIRETIWRYVKEMLKP